MSELIDQISARCVEIGACWEWQGALQRRGSSPVMRWQGQTITVRRLVLQHMGVNVEKRVCTVRCGNFLCVNPQHIEAIARKKLSRRVAEMNSYSVNMLRRVRLARKARERAKLTENLASQIREAEGSQRAIAARYGVSQATVNAILRGRIWVDLTNPYAQLLGAK